MKTDYLSVLVCFTFVSLTVAATSSSNDTNLFCNLPAAKRMLGKLGIDASSSKCLLQRKRDVAQLVTSYFEKMAAPAKDEKKSIVDEIEALLMEGISKEEKRGQYCCSPDCDGFMARMGAPSASLIHCN